MQYNEKKWCVLQVKPRSEKKVGKRLESLGFEVCVPTQKQYKAWSDRKKLVEVVIFNNYVFVATDLKHRNEVFLVENVHKYIQFAGKVATLSNQEIAMVKGLSNLTTPVHINYEYFEIGEEVEIVSGSLKGFRGKVTGSNGHSKIQLALPSLLCFANVELMNTEIRRLPTQ